MMTMCGRRVNRNFVRWTFLFEYGHTQVPQMSLKNRYFWGLLSTVYHSVTFALARQQDRVAYGGCVVSD